MKPACLALLLLTAATLAEKTQPLFTDVAQRAGIHAIVRSGSAEKRYLPETVTGGVCLIDYDNDGYLDIYIVNGSNLEAVRSGHHAYDNHLYRNRGNGNFEDVTEKAGVAGSAGWLGRQFVRWAVDEVTGTVRPGRDGCSTLPPPPSRRRPRCR